MNYYFKLQFLRLQRTLSALGINVYLGILLSLVIFIAFSKYLFLKLAFQEYIYCLIALITIFSLSEKTRNEKIKLIFSKKHYHQIRLIENFFLSLPFAIYLVYEGKYLISLMLLAIGVMLCLVQANWLRTIKVPTPFRRWPFEFVRGFRTAFPLLLFLYAICIIACNVNNFNLGLFCFGATFLVAMSFNLKPEKIYFVWIYKMNAKEFLLHKLWNAFICMTILSLPFLITLLICFSDHLLPIALLQLVGLVFLASAIFAKYAAYPNEINVAQGFLYALSLWFPPMLLIVIPIFYLKSRKQLKLILE